MNTYLKRFSPLMQKLNQHKTLAMIIAIALITGGTFLGLSMPAATATPQLICGKEEHVHTDECYKETRTLICGKEENVQQIADGTEGTEPEIAETHIHTDECYQAEKELICGKEEHAHTEECYEQAGTLKSETSDHMIAEVSYDAGVIHQDTYLTAKKLDGETEENTLKLIQKELNEEKELITVSRSYDLKLQKDEKSVVPDGKVDLSMKFQTYISADENNESISWRLFYIDEEDNVTELTKEQTTEIVTDDENEVKEVILETADFDRYVLIGTAAVQEEVPEDVQDDAQDETETKESYPTQNFEASAGGIRVSVTAEEGAFPAGTTMKVSLVEDQDVLDMAIDAAGVDNAKAKAVDISFTDAEGKEIEPKKPIRVTMKADEISTTNEIAVVHVDDDNQASVVENSDKTVADEVVFDSDAFSTYAIVYTVDFSYGEYTYSIEGNSRIRLSELLKKLQVFDETGSLIEVADIQEVSFSDETLVEIQVDGEDWVLKSLQAFTSEEELVITLKNEDQIHIQVTDEQSSGMTVTGVTLKVNGNTYDLKNTLSINIKNTDQFEVTMNYEVAPYTLSNGNNTIIYDLPSGIKINRAITNQNIYQGRTKVGTYSIDTNGHVTFVYNDNYVSQNSSGSSIKADLSFEASVDESKITNDGKINIDFSNELSTNLNVEKAEVGDLSVRKQVNHTNYRDGYLEYQVVVHSSAGTSEKITLNDVITTTGLKINSIEYFSIRPNNTNVQPSVNGTSGYNLTLPKLESNSDYIITYRVYFDKSQVPITGALISNKVTGESETSKGNKLKNSADINTTVKPNNDDIVKKEEVSRDKETNTVSWKVTVNSAKTNLNGWTLSDTLNRKPFTGTVTVNPVINGQSQITLPYTWQSDDRTTYIITYTTTADKLPGQSATLNKADLSKGSDTISTGEKNGGEWGYFDPLEKDATSIQPNEANTQAIVDWKVTINSKASKIAAGWVYKDELQNGQWFTGTQLKAIKAAVDNAIQPLKLSYEMKANLLDGTDSTGTEVSYNQIKGSEKYKVYTLNFSSELPKGKSFTYNYQSTAPIAGLEKDTTFCNSAYVESGEKNYDDGQIVYVPPKKPEIFKTDNGSSGDTSHDIASLNGTFDWDLKVTIPENYKGTTLTVKEYLPAGVKLNDLTILAKGNRGNIFDLTQFTELDIGKHSLSVSQSGKTYQIPIELVAREDGGIDAIITLPENLVKYSETTTDGKKSVIQEVDFVVTVKPTGTSDWTKDNDGYIYKKFGNTVELIDKDNQTISSDSQDQTIRLNDGGKLVSKAATTVPNNNTVDYSLKINEKGKDLLDGSDTIILKDIQTHTYDAYYEVDAVYVDGSLKVYSMNADGSKGEPLSKDDYSFTYKETIDYVNQNKGTAVNTITVTLPDHTPLIVEYQYLVSEPNGGFGKNTTLHNKAYLEGYTENRYSDETSTYVVVQKSSAHASIEGVSLLKVDAYNYELKLSGVKFNLERYDGGTYVPTGRTYTTDAFGKINFTANDITYKTAYKLTEESTVSGYFKEKAPFYFIVTDTVLKQGETASYTAPDDFNGKIYNKGDTFYIENRKIPDKGLSVSKVWKDDTGNVVEDTTDMPEITARLKKGNEVIETFTLSEENGWTEVFNNLDSDGQYTVEEATTLTGYNPPLIVYEQGDGTKVRSIAGGSYGSATITNQPSSPPPSGGSTRVAVKKNWVDTDGKTKLTGSALENQEASVELVRYKAPQAGTRVHFMLGESNESTNWQYVYKPFFEDIVVAKQDSVSISFKASNWDNSLFLQDSKILDGTSFWSVNKETNKIQNSGTQIAEEIVMTYTFSTAGKDEIYLYANRENYHLLPESGIIIAAGSEGTYGTPVLDRSYQGIPEILNVTNDWNVVFTGLPLSGTEEGITYSYTYAIKETNCSEGFEFLSYSVGSDEKDNVNIPISKPSSNITITNKKKEAYELPHTGGTGTLKYILSGFSLMIIALLLFLRRKPDEGRSMEKG